MSEISPMMKQYLEIKSQHKDDVLFFRVGDFYEMFFEDAVRVSKEIDLTLTGKDCGLESRAPMCGIPFHSSETYIKKLIDLGHRVAICEQVEDPSSAKGLVKRDVIRIVTPGTVIEESMLDEGKNNFICSVSFFNGEIGLCFCDISTGQVNLMSFNDNFSRSLIKSFSRFEPREIIAPKAIYDLPDVFKFISTKLNCSFTLIENPNTDAVEACDRMAKVFLKQHVMDLGIEEKHVSSVLAFSEILNYLDHAHMENHLCITALKIHDDKQFMNLDITARRNLEITQTMRSGEKKGSLLWVLDKTKTAMGRRLIRTFLEQPLTSRIKIEKRLNAVEELFERPVLLDKIRTLLSDITDIERLITRIAYSSASPRDIKSLQYTCEKLPEFLDTLSNADSKLLKEQFESIDAMQDIKELIENSLNDELPIAIKDGNVIRDGYNKDLDELRDIIKNATGYLAKLEADEKEKTGIKTLKIGYNRVFGYYLEVSKSFVSEVPETYIRKQTLTTGERYITEELKELESKILTANTKIQSLELSIFNQIRDYIAKQLIRVQKTAQSIAYIDVLSSFAKVAFDNSYTRPDISNKDEIVITEGRHPVVENLLKDAPFVSNDTHLDGVNDRIAIITGPNMAGKSTYMRQVAIIVLMAQIGSFVPAKSASIGIVDSIFTRVGASDDLASGQSTFMVEMNEVATILKDATSKSLIILDEVGRGTSTFDGMSIARAVVEYIADQKKIGAKTLFATHYHELTAMENELDCVKNYNIAVKKRGDDITFLRRIVKGAADDSYGIEVAKLAGIPDAVIKRAKEVLNKLADGEEISKPKPREIKNDDDFGQVSLIGTSENSAVAQELKNLDIETLTPIEALNKLYELKKLV